MANRNTSNCSYRAMVGQLASVTPAWPPAALKSVSVPSPPEATQPLDAIYRAQPKASFLWDMARDAMEDIATLRSHRIPEPHESWRDPDRAEQRLLNQIDASVNCGPESIGRLYETSRELETPDPDWMYAVTLVLGSLKEEQALQWTLRLLKDSAGRDPEEVAAVVEAFCLVPYPDIGPMLIPLVSDASTPVRQAAVQVLSYRGLLPAGIALRSLSDPAPEVVAVAIESFITMDVTSALAPIRALLNHADERITRASLRVLFRAGMPEGRQRALSLCASKPEYAEACLVVGLSGVQSDFPVLERLLTEAPSPMVVRACGCFGDPRLIPRLVELLSDDKVKPLAVEALERLTAAGLRADEPGPPRQIADPDSWNKWWGSNRARFSSGRRYRLGRPYGPSALLHELDQSGNRVERLRAYLELCRFAGPNTPRFQPLDFIPKQDESLRALRQWVEANSSLDQGKWSLR